VNNSGTLAGDAGTVGNVIVNSGGTFSPGGSATFDYTITGDLNLNAGSILSVQLDSTNASLDRIGLSGNLNIANGALLSVFDIGANPEFIIGTAAPLLDYEGVWNGGTFLNLPNNESFAMGGRFYQISYDGGGGDSVVTLTMLDTIPEPGSTVSLLGGLGLLLGMRRRRVS
jgi:hypothetical protein